MFHYYDSLCILYIYVIEHKCGNRICLKDTSPAALCGAYCTAVRRGAFLNFFPRWTGISLGHCDSISYNTNFQESTLCVRVSIALHFTRITRILRFFYIFLSLYFSENKQFFSTTIKGFCSNRSNTTRRF